MDMITLIKMASILLIFIAIYTFNFFFYFFSIGSVILTYSKERVNTRLLRDNDGFLLPEKSVSVCHSCVNSWLICSISLIYSRYLLTDSFFFSIGPRDIFLSLRPTVLHPLLTPGARTLARLYTILLFSSQRESTTL